MSYSLVMIIAGLLALGVFGIGLTAARRANGASRRENATPPGPN